MSDARRGFDHHVRTVGNDSSGKDNGKTRDGSPTFYDHDPALQCCRLLHVRLSATNFRRGRRRCRDMPVDDPTAVAIGGCDTCFGRRRR